jgi:hypothetical protein
MAIIGRWIGISKQEQKRVGRGHVDKRYSSKFAGIMEMYGITSFPVLVPKINGFISKS